MPFPNAEKKRLVDGQGLTDRSLFIALGLGSTELGGHGYARGESPAAMNSSDANGVVTIAAGQTIYTANDGAAQDSTHMRIYRSAGGGEADAVTDWQAHNDVEAPVDGQSVVTGAITITP